MSAKKMGLGRGFDSLIPTELLDESFDGGTLADGQVSDLRHIKLTEIHPDPDQPRRNFDEEALNELAASVKEHGILQPIVVRPFEGGYMIVAGERRYRASKLAGLDKIPALVRTLTKQNKLELSLIENLQRSDLNIMETAAAYALLRDEHGLKLDEIGERVGKSTAAISNTLRLLRLPKAVLKALHDGKMTEGQARPLVNVDPKVIEKILPRILSEGWSARVIEQYVANLNYYTENTKQRPTSTPEAGKYEKQMQRFADRFATPVKVRTNAKGAGQIVIKFKDDDEFQRIAKMLG